MWDLPVPVLDALSRIQSVGKEAYIVGGCVRDYCMHRPPKDYDITTSAVPEETIQIFSNERTIETGRKHGTITVILDGEPLEITSFRVDNSYSDGRHPDSVRFTTSLSEDLARRDFTINAMAYSPISGLVDPFGGKNDIALKMIRCVGDPACRFQEDALRILRALRFSSVLGFCIDSQTDNALRQAAPLLKFVSAERKTSELQQLLCGSEVKRVLLDYPEVFGEVIPELLPLYGFEQKNPHHCYDIMTHCATMVESVPAQPELRFAALLHDIGKPRCFHLDGTGIGHFYGHASLSAEIADSILERLRFDHTSRNIIVTLVRYHDLQIDCSEAGVRRALNRLTPGLFFQLLALQRADNLAQSPDRRNRQQYYDIYETMALKILEENQCFSLRNLAVKGQDLGLPPGPAIGKGLSLLLDAVIDNKVANERDALLKYFHIHNKDIT